jgi:hypothetical protein
MKISNLHFSICIFQFLSAFRFLLSAFCFLPSAFCLLLSAFCFPPSAFRLLAFCLLLSAFCFLLRGHRVGDLDPAGNDVLFGALDFVEYRLWD